MKNWQHLPTYNCVIITWRLYVGVCKGCESCGSWIHSPSHSWAWSAALSPLFWAPRRCSVATPRGGAVPVAEETHGIGVGWWWEEKVGDKFARSCAVGHWISILHLWQSVHSACKRHRWPPWSDAMFAQWIMFHLCLLAMNGLHLGLPNLLLLNLQTSEWLIYWPNRKKSIQVPSHGSPCKEPFNESDYT